MLPSSNEPQNVSHETESFTRLVRAQIELVRAGRRKHVFHGGKLCSKCYGPRPAYRQDHYCASCRKFYTRDRRGKA